MRTFPILFSLPQRVSDSQSRVEAYHMAERFLIIIFTPHNHNWLIYHDRSTLMAVLALMHVFSYTRSNSKKHAIQAG
jgi:hypothetical protein